MNLELPEQPAWMALGLCSQTDPELFFPDRGGPNHDAKRVCSGCPVQTACREHALAHETRGAGGWGIWGGMTYEERQRELRRRGRGGRPGRQRKDTAA
ncbi:WhiB family transcriptional regulator [Pseudonocardia parietis]|uniref:Transcriptional regulator WhiB n=1 Tax=Pseudonocardia parietis TaxID=570936 RepID=A0ABS4W269_9PSEU|nr:WhiB family transcriptional regulator [Pseudonocardia parietis]MBP2370289.1 WhiB family redox-sensing transcriptional regulator [Pseudonocardia parietis]